MTSFRDVDGWRSPTRLQAEPLGQSAPCSTLSKAPLYQKSHSQSTPVSPFFNQNEIEQHGIKAREITQKLIKSLNETKGRLERQHVVRRDLSPCVDNILEQTVTISSNKEPCTKRRLFHEEAPSSIMRKPTSPKKLGPVVFDTRPDNEWTDNSFNTLQQGSYRSGYANSDCESIGYFDEPVRRSDFEEREFIHGLRELDEITRSSKAQQERQVPLSPGAKKAMDTLSYGPAMDLRREDYTNVTSEEIREIEGVRSHLHTMLQSSPKRRDASPDHRDLSPNHRDPSPKYRDTSEYSTNPRSTSCSRSPSRESFNNNSSSNTLTNEARSTSCTNLSTTQRNGLSNGSAQWSSQSPRRGRSPVRRWAGGTDWAAVAKKEAERTSYADLDFDEIMQLASHITTRSREQAMLDPLEKSAEPGQMEVRVLKENCDREKYRRQHCERIIETLQRRLADSQEQLTISISTERKKDIMIDQLDQTLSRVVDGWKQREAEKQTFIEKLKVEREELNKKMEDKTEMMAKFESDLQEALADLAVEQKKVADLEKFKEEEHEKEHERLSSLMEQQQQKMKEVEKERDELNRELTELRRKYAELEDTLLEERSGWQETTEDLKLKINNLDADFRDCLTSEKQRADDTEEALGSTKEVLASVQKELLRCQADLDTVTRERNTLRVDMGLLEARMESSKRKLEADLNAEFDKTLSKKLLEAEDNHLQNEKDLRESHQKIMQELSEKSQKTMDEAIQTLKENFMARERAYKDEINTLEERLNYATKDYQDLRLQKQRIEAQRDRLYPEGQWHDIKKEDLVKNLRSLMDSHGTRERGDHGSQTDFDESKRRTSRHHRSQSPATNHGRRHSPDRAASESRDQRRDQSERRAQDSNEYNSHDRVSPKPYHSHNGPQPTNERQRNIEEAFNLQSPPSSYPPSVGRYGADSDFGKQRLHFSLSARKSSRPSQYNNNNDGVSDVLSNDGHDFYPNSEPSTRYATPTFYLSSNHYAPSHHAMETPRAPAPYCEPFQTPVIIAPPVATSTELRPNVNRRFPDQPRTGSLMSSGYYTGNVTPPPNRFSVSGPREFIPLQPSNDTTSYDPASARSDQVDGPSQHPLYLTRPTLGSRDPLDESTRSQQEPRSGQNFSQPSVQDSFRFMANGSSYLDLSDAQNNQSRQAELQRFVHKLLNPSDTPSSAENSKENLPPLLHSPPQRLERAHIDYKDMGGKGATPTGVLTPGQVGEIQRLLESLQQNNGLADRNLNKIEDLLMYLKDVQKPPSANESPSVTTSGNERTVPTSDARLVSVSHAPKYSSSTSVARQKLYERSNRIVAGPNPNYKSSSNSTTKSRQMTKPDRKNASKYDNKSTPVWR